MSADNGGPAFPRDHASGLSLRDYFAAKAMLAFISEPVEGVREAVFWNMSDKTASAVANASYAMADAMLKERAK